MGKEVGINCMTVVPFPQKAITTRSGQTLLVTENPTLDWHRSFAGMICPVNWNSSICYPEGLLVDEARNWAVERAREIRAKYLFFIDYDVLVPPDAMLRLSYDMDHHPEADVFCGVYCSKSEVPQPLIFNGDGNGPWWDWKIGEIREIDGCHMGLTMIRMSAFDRIDAEMERQNRVEKYYLTERKVTSRGSFIGTEDLHYCKLVKAAGGRIFADCQVIAGHQDIESHRVYGLPKSSNPVSKSWMELRDKRVALDIGCGETRNDFPDYDVTLRIDAREEVEPDYVCDVRHIPFPDEFAEFIFTSHTLEHFGRWEVGDVLREWVRVLKPGGKVRIVVPSILWAAKVIVASGFPDRDAMNVLYGAQEAQGYARELNSHHTGFTPQTLSALAQDCGLTVESVTDDSVDPAMGYDIVLDASKPDDETSGHEHAEDTE